MERENSPIERVVEWYESGNLPITLRGRKFDLRDLRVIHQCIARFYEAGRTRISKEICEELNWKQPNGWLKDRACRDVLLRLEEMELVELPPRLVQPRKKNKEDKANKDTTLLMDFDLESPLSEMPENLTLEFAKGDEKEKVWNELVDKFHYLGHNVVVGRCIKYLLYGDERLIGAIAFASPAWKLEVRDEILGELGYDLDWIRRYVVNNCRFLIMPYARIDNLASRLLSLATEKIVEDWEWYYAIEPKLVETFVQPSLFEGTCYKAANWVEVGKTRGYAKKGRSHHNSQEPKQVFLYGLNRWIRRQLKRKVDKDENNRAPSIG